MAGKEYGGTGDAGKDGYTCLSSRSPRSHPDDPFKPHGEGDDGYFFGGRPRPYRPRDVNTRPMPRGRRRGDESGDYDADY